MMEANKLDIGIYTTKHTIEHNFSGGYWWFKATMPKVEEGDRFWVALEGRWRGFFTVDEVLDLDYGGEVWFFGWVEKDGGERKPFQGFTYKVPKNGGNQQ